MKYNYYQYGPACIYKIKGLECYRYRIWGEGWVKVNIPLKRRNDLKQIDEDDAFLFVMMHPERSPWYISK